MHRQIAKMAKAVLMHSIARQKLFFKKQRYSPFQAVCKECGTTCAVYVAITMSCFCTQVGVHIADVSHFIRPGTAIDKEAAGRGTTVYLIDKVAF